ncbi:unnamed protein product [Ranitomeya imitator]|uniref:Spindle and centriole-associated protein 1 n=1 Tax=Ranitomeya imitator TaxID=111125 RepID=A0ABN9LKL6_9NEOB|nr:unnamed protein product [Ranitomeya imitator]
MSRPVPVPEQMEAPTNNDGAHPLTAHGLQRRDSPAPHPGYDTSSIEQAATAFGDTGSLLDLEPAIMLSPPRQRTWSGLGDQYIVGGHDVFSSSSDALAAQRWNPPSQDLPPVAPREDALISRHHTEHRVPERTSAPLRDGHDITSRMAELTCQNNALKAQLQQFFSRTDSVDASQSVNGVVPGPGHVVTQPPAPYRTILFVGPSRRRARPIDASLPMPQFTDSSLEGTPPIDSSHRSGASQRSDSSATGSSRGRRAASEASWMKVGKDKEEGWFALSAHIS